MIEIHMQNCEIGLAENPAFPGIRFLRIFDKDSKIATICPLDQMAALQLANALSGKAIVVPQFGPPPPPPEK